MPAPHGPALKKSQKQPGYADWWNCNGTETFEVKGGRVAIKKEGVARQMALVCTRFTFARTGNEMTGATPADCSEEEEKEN